MANELKRKLKETLEQKGGILPSCYSSNTPEREKTPFEIELETKKQRVKAIIYR